ncbi:hypothetical protein CHARACLAT_027395 [Characodon lateralis]|uniref:Uncharacterized protein n=1 Tax=Characodon lateralis TaxID=208331 RepID=A0ABU7E711_9TELE|nr:hypothetical protein [Characodon lateralis]
MNTFGPGCFFAGRSKLLQLVGVSFGLLCIIQTALNIYFLQQQVEAWRLGAPAGAFVVPIVLAGLVDLWVLHCGGSLMVSLGIPGGPTASAGAGLVWTLVGPDT